MCVLGRPSRSLGLPGTVRHSLDLGKPEGKGRVRLGVKFAERHYKDPQMEVSGQRERKAVGIGGLGSSPACPARSVDLGRSLVPLGFGFPFLTITESQGPVSVVEVT